MKHLRITIAFALIICFLFSSLTPALASNPTIPQEQAMEKVKNLFDTSGFDRFNINYNEDMDGRKAWQLEWSMSKEPHGSLNAYVDADTGNILNLYIYKGYDPNEKSPLIPKFSEEDAKKVAEAFGKKLQPEEFSKTQLEKRDEPVYYPKRGVHYPREYHFYFNRREGGIPVDGDGFNITIDANTCDIINYNFNWTKGTLPPSDKLISKEEVEKKFKDEFGLKLIYKRYFDYTTRKDNIKLVYTLEDPYRILIDAITGELIERDHYYGYDGESRKMASEQSADFTPMEQEEIEATKNCISKDMAINIVKKYITIPKEYVQRYANLYEYYENPDQKIWNISWEKKTDKEDSGDGNIYARVNAVTSELISFDFYTYRPYREDFKQKFDREAAQKKAEEFLMDIEPKRFKEVELEEPLERPTSPEKIREHYFRFTRQVNNIPYTANGFNITVDAETGKVISYNMNWYEKDFPEVNGSLTLEKANDNFLKDIGFELAYIPIYNSKEASTKFYLAYRLKPSDSYDFDAFEFKPLDYRGKPIGKETATAFNDIAGHWAEKDIQLLVDLGVIKSSESHFRPNDSMTQGEFIKLLVIAQGHGATDDGIIPLKETKNADEIQKYIDTAIKIGWVKENEVEPNKPISREKTAAFMVRALGYEAIANLSDIFKLNIKDESFISPQYKGHTAIAFGLRLLTEEAGNLKPKQNMSRAETAVLLVRMLKMAKY